jgi:hypothetical protein
MVLVLALAAPGCKQTAPPTPPPPAATCADLQHNGSETDVDCGGGSASGCPACADGLACVIGADCQSGLCSPQRRCVEAGCDDGISDLGESGVDCGGGVCPACPDRQACDGHADCASGFCNLGRCETPTCSDRAWNGGETDVDCGGPCSAKCAAGQRCLSDGDCGSGHCQGTLCVAAACTNLVQDPGESDVDCGGSCAPCATGQRCTQPYDCLSGACEGPAGATLCADLPLAVSLSSPRKGGAAAATSPILLVFNRPAARASVIPCASAQIPAGCNVLLQDASGAVLRLQPDDVAVSPASFQFGHRPLLAGASYSLTVKSGPAGPAARSGGDVLPAPDFVLHFTAQ